MIEVEVHFPAYSVTFNVDTDSFGAEDRYLNALGSQGTLYCPGADGVLRFFSRQHITHISAREVTPEQ